MVGRPVKLVLSREQMFRPVGHRAPTRQTLRLGADSNGKLDRARSPNEDDGEHLRRFLRAGDPQFAYPLCEPIHLHSHEAVRVDTGTPLFMRAPGEGRAGDGRVIPPELLVMAML
jgi:xanthine dehydrogenase YagR molybdenum-binding subunit